MTSFVKQNVLQPKDANCLGVLSNNNNTTTNASLLPPKNAQAALSSLGSKKINSQNSIKANENAYNNGMVKSLLSRTMGLISRGNTFVQQEDILLPMGSRNPTRPGSSNKPRGSMNRALSPAVTIDISQQQKHEGIYTAGMVARSNSTGEKQDKQSGNNNYPRNSNSAIKRIAPKRNPPSNELTSNVSTSETYLKNKSIKTIPTFKISRPSATKANTSRKNLMNGQQQQQQENFDSQCCSVGESIPEESFQQQLRNHSQNYSSQQQHHHRIRVGAQQLSPNRAELLEEEQDDGGEYFTKKSSHPHLMNQQQQQQQQPELQGIQVQSQQELLTKKTSKKFRKASLEKSSSSTLSQSLERLNHQQQQQQQSTESNSTYQQTRTSLELAWKKPRSISLSRQGTKKLPYSLQTNSNGQLYQSTNSGLLHNNSPAAAANHTNTNLNQSLGTGATLRLQLMTKKHNWRDVVKQSLNGKQFESIEIVFYDIIVEIFDGLLFNTQSRCLRHLNLNFRENKYFNDESLSFLSAIKLSSLQTVKVNVSATKCSRIAASLLFFDFSYVPCVELTVGASESQSSSSPVQTLKYLKSEHFIEIDFSVQKRISKSEIIALSDSLYKSNHQYLRINLTGVPFKGDLPAAAAAAAADDANALTHEKLRLLGRCIQEVKHIQIVFSKCNLARADIRIFLEGLSSVRAPQSTFPIEQSQQQQQSNTTTTSYDASKTKPLSFWMKQKQDDHHHHNQNPLSQTLTASKDNTFIESLQLDLRQNSEDIDQEFVYGFRIFKNLRELKLIVDPEKQVRQQYEGESAYCLAERLLIERVNKIEIAISETQSIFSINKLSKELSINASNCSVSPFQLVDIAKALNSCGRILHLTLNLSNNWQLSYANIKKLIEKIPYFLALHSLHLNIQNVFIYEIEFTTLYFLLHRIPSLHIHHDFTSANLVTFNNFGKSLALAFKGPFSRSKICNSADMHEFCTALESNSLTHITSVAVTFFYNYGLRADSLVRLSQSLAKFANLEKLNLNFNSCFLSFQDILAFAQALNAIETPLQSLKLTFTNNDNVSADSLIDIAKYLHKFSQLKHLHIVCDTQELILDPLQYMQSLGNVFNKINTQIIPSRRNLKSKVIVDRVVPRIYSLLSHQIESNEQNNSAATTTTPPSSSSTASTTSISHNNNPATGNRPKISNKQQQQQLQLMNSNNELKRNSTYEEDNDDEHQHASIYSETSIAAVMRGGDQNNLMKSLTEELTTDKDDQLNTTAKKPSRIVKTNVQNWVALNFKDSVIFSDEELLQLALDLAVNENVHNIMTVPYKPAVEALFYEIKATALSVIPYEALVAPHLSYVSTDIFADLFNCENPNHTVEDVVVVVAGTPVASLDSVSI